MLLLLLLFGATKSMKIVENDAEYSKIITFDQNFYGRTPIFRPGVVLFSKKFVLGTGLLIEVFSGPSVSGQEEDGQTDTYVT